MDVQITERTFYPIIGEVFKDVARKYSVNITYIIEPLSRLYNETREPDLFITIDGHRLLVPVKIGKIGKLYEDLVKYYPMAREIDANLILILFPEDVRRIPPQELERVGPHLSITRCFVLTPWLSKDYTNVILYGLIKDIITSFLDYKKTLIPIVDYKAIATIARDSIEDLAIILRRYMGVKKYVDIVQTIVGRFDFYKAMIGEFIEKEEVMKTYIADIIAYLTVIQLLFIHIVSIKKLDFSILPKIENPLNPPANLINILKTSLSSTNLTKEYINVIGSLYDILDLLFNIEINDSRIRLILSKYIYSIQVLRPENVREELYGRIYQEGIPPETRKNLGAFFTKPEAARLLAGLAIRQWDDKVLDPACGSGTLLAESYHVKFKKAIMGEVKLDHNKLHELFIDEHIYGIDIMQFARELTAVNLSLQRPEVYVKPKVFVGDGITKMYFTEDCKEEDPPHTFLDKFLKTAQKEYEELKLKREGFDVVIMNPPFTRRERIPECERKILDKLLGNIVRGKTGYWAYFFVAADDLIKFGGRLAAVTPEEFFAGAAAESVRRYILLGEVYDKNEKIYRRKLDRSYRLRYIIKSGVELAFSEQAHYRDYLMVMEKLENSKMNNPLMVFVILKKRLSELKGQEDVILKQLIEFGNNEMNSISTEYFDAIKINVEPLIKKYTMNLKPLVSSNFIKTKRLLLELLESLGHFPTLANIAFSIRAYNPGQYITRGIENIEDYARRLFAYRYGSKGKQIFRIIGEEDNIIKLGVGTASIEFRCPKNSCIPSLRSPAGVKIFNISGAEEIAIVDVSIIPSDIRRISGLVDDIRLSRAAEDVRQAYQDLSSNILLGRRIRLTSPNIYWLAFFSEKPLLNTAVLVNLTTNLTMEFNKLLTLYLNSSIALFQLLAFCVETEGAWVDLHGEQVWSNIHIPDFSSLPRTIASEVLDLFNRVGKIGVKPLYERIKMKDDIQKQIDIAALKMFGFTDWLSRLNDIYDAITDELTAMKNILERSQKEKKRSREKENGGEETQTTLEKYF